MIYICHMNKMTIKSASKKIGVSTEAFYFQLRKNKKDGAYSPDTFFIKIKDKKKKLTLLLKVLIIDNKPFILFTD